MRWRSFLARLASASMNTPRRLTKDSAFTLIELLVVVAIIAILTAILVPVAGMMAKKGRMSRELNAAKNLMAAYAAYSTAHDGQLIKGYDKTETEVSLPGGVTVSGEMVCRYPWRLAEFLGGQLEGVFLVNDNTRQTAKLHTDSFEYQYRASLNPAFGINAYCVGGFDDGSGSGFFSSDVVTRMAGASNSSRLIVFATARMKQTGVEDTPGNFLVVPPRLWRTQWSRPFDPKKTSASFGNVDLRWDNKAICAFLDGHVEMLGEEEIVDMRRWSNTAAENNDPNFSVPR